MKNNTRKILLALLLVFTMLMSFTSVSAFAESADTKTYYFSNNKGWSTVNVHYWGGTSQCTWPGVAATFVKTNEFGEGIYSITIPADATSIIFNNGSEQTVDIDLSLYTTDGFYLTEKNAEGKWAVGTYAFSESGNENSGSGSGSTETPSGTEGELAKGDYYLAGYINGADYGIEANAANLGSYKFVDGKLSVELAQAAYVVVKDSANNIYWSPTYVDSAKSATLYKGDKADKLYVPGGKITFTLYHGSNGSLVLSYEVEAGTEIEIPTIDETDTVTVYVSNTMGWDTVFYYCWVSGGSSYVEWPGLEMELDENGYWYAEVPKACDNIIFNNGNGGSGNQTLDLKTPTTDKNVCDVKVGLKDDINSNINCWYTKAECKPYIPAPKEDTNREVTLVLKNSANWASVYVYFWSSENVAGTAWPGIKLEAASDGLYYAVIPKGNYSVIFNNGQEGEALVQTGDMVIPTNDNVLYDNATGTWSEMRLDANHPAGGSDNGDNNNNSNEGNTAQGMTWLQHIAKAILLFLRSIEDFFKGLFG